MIKHVYDICPASSLGVLVLTESIFTRTIESRAQDWQCVLIQCDTGASVWFYWSMDIQGTPNPHQASFASFEISWPPEDLKYDALLYWSLKMASTFVVMGPDMSVIIMLPTIGSLCFLFSCIFSAPLVKQTVGQWAQGNENPVKCLDSTWAFACCLFLKGSPQSRHLQIDTPPSTGDSLTIFSSQAASTSEENQFLLSISRWITGCAK